MASSETVKVGFTAGTFDFVHAAHVCYLIQAKKACDYLIVGIKADPSIDVRGKNKPIMSPLERQVQIRALECVDETLVYQTEKELLSILNWLDIDIRIIGDEYLNQEFTGKKVCEDKGICTKFVKRGSGISSTIIRARMDTD